MPVKKLIVQIGTYSSSPNIMSLFSFPSYSILPKHFKIVLSRWARGKMHRNTFNLIEKRDGFIENYQTSKFNDTDIKYSFEPYDLADGSIKVLEITGYLRLSPFNGLWDEVYGYILKERKQEAQRRACEDREIKIRFCNLSRYPTLCVYVIKFISPLDKLDILAAIRDVIGDELSNLSAKVDIFACADIEEHLSVLGFDLIDNLVRHPMALDRLDTYFDDYHDVLFASNDLCMKIASSSYWVKYVENNHMIVAPNCDVVSVCPECFVPKDNTTEGPKPGPEDGEYKIGTYGVKSRRRLKYLIEHKLLHSSMTYASENPLETWTFFPAIQDKYADLIKLNPDDMVMLHYQKFFADKISEEVNKNFDLLSDIAEIKNRIWVSHERAYDSVGCIPNEIITFVKERFFSC